MNSSALSRRKHRTLLVGAAAATAAAAILGLTGCTLDFLPQQDRQAEQDRKTEAPAESQPPITEPDGDASGGDGSGSGENPAPLAAGSQARADYAGSVERTISCPGGALDIADISSVIALDSDCTDITVSGAGTVLLASNIDRLTVIGVDNIVFVDRLGSLDVSGQGNVVAWEDGSPTVANTGIDNQLNPAA